MNVAVIRFPGANCDDDALHVAGRVIGGTFHSVGNRLLRRFADRLGYPSNYGILDREDARELLGTCIGVEVERQADFLEADRDFLAHSQRSAEVEIALGADRAAAHLDAERGGHRLQRHPGAGDQRLRQPFAAELAGHDPQPLFLDRFPWPVLPLGRRNHVGMRVQEQPLAAAAACSARLYSCTCPGLAVFSPK